MTVEWQSSLQEEAPVSNLARPSPPEPLQNNNGRGRFGRLEPPGIEARVSHAARKIHSRPVRPIGGERNPTVYHMGDNESQTGSHGALKRLILRLPMFEQRTGTFCDSSGYSFYYSWNLRERYH